MFVIFSALDGCESQHVTMKEGMTFTIGKSIDTKEIRISSNVKVVIQNLH